MSFKSDCRWIREGTKEHRGIGKDTPVEIRTVHSCFLKAMTMAGCPNTCPLYERR